MKINLREFIEPEPSGLKSFEKLLDANHPEKPTERGFERLMSGVKAGCKIEQFRNGAEKPQSVQELIETACQSVGMRSVDLAARLKVNSRQWAAIMNHAQPPQELPVAAYATISRMFRVGFAALESAIRGSYRLFLQSSAPTMHVRFAQSSVSSRSTKNYSKSLAKAFTELRSKSKIYRQNDDFDSALHAFLTDLSTCIR